MTTAELIKILQEADPSGEAHIRMDGGIPKYAVLKEGYWDGPYSYLDENDNWVYSTKNNKVDLYCEDIEDFVSESMDTYDIPDWEEIKSKFKFELSCYANDSQRIEKEESFLKRVKVHYDSSASMYNKFRKEGDKRAIERSNKGWTWFQNKLVDDKSLKQNLHHYYTWKIYDENGKEQGSTPHNVQSVYKSGLFERKDNNVKKGYYQWIKK